MLCTTVTVKPDAEPAKQRHAAIVANTFENKTCCTTAAKTASSIPYGGWRPWDTPRSQDPNACRDLKLPHTGISNTECGQLLRRYQPHDGKD